MALPTGLVPVLAFVLTVGLAVPVTLGAHLFHRNGTGSFVSALRAALIEAGLLYLVGVVVIWSIAGGVELWEVPATLVVTGVVALFGLMVLPLAVGRRLVRRVKRVDSETALRFATYGWSMTMVVVFGVFVAYRILTRDLYHPGSEQLCLVGFCGIGVSFAAAVLVEAIVAVLGPAIFGLVLYSSSATARTLRASS